ncbi:hypothetical protein APHDU1_0984 [Anaplasma phagocytophilum]|nr:hypothetical protein APHDU1_0984 [Anaplasma phagocytophilum]
MLSCISCRIPDHKFGMHALALRSQMHKILRYTQELLCVQ